MSVATVTTESLGYRTAQCWPGPSLTAALGRTGPTPHLHTAPWVREMPRPFISTCGRWESRHWNHENSRAALLLTCCSTLENRPYTLPVQHGRGDPLRGGEHKPVLRAWEWESWSPAIHLSCSSVGKGRDAPSAPRSSPPAYERTGPRVMRAR